MASTNPAYNEDGHVVGGVRGPKVSGTADSNDPTLQEGQYPPGGWGSSIFGGPLPDGTGAPGTAGARWSAGTDPTNEPGQTEDGLTGISEDEITQTGAPGTQGAQDSTGGADSVSFTTPGSYLTGSYDMQQVSDDVSGPGDWTGANDEGYATGGPQLPGIRGNEPQAGSSRYQPGGGRVLRGGRDVRP